MISRGMNTRMAFGLAAALMAAPAIQAKIAAVLVYSHEGAGAYRHTNGISAGNGLITSLGTLHGFTVTISEDPNFMTYENMKKFDVIVFNNTVGAALPATTSQDAFVKYMNEGGGFVGIHG